MAASYTQISSLAANTSQTVTITNNSTVMTVFQILVSSMNTFSASFATGASGSPTTYAAFYNSSNEPNISIILDPPAAISNGQVAQVSVTNMGLTSATINVTLVYQTQ